MARPAVGAVRRPFLSPRSRRGRNGTGSSRLLSGRREVVEIALGAGRVHVLGPGATRQNEGGRESRGRPRAAPRRRSSPGFFAAEVLDFLSAGVDFASMIAIVARLLSRAGLGTGPE